MFVLIIVGIVLLVGIDQLTKYLIVFNLHEGQSITAINGILNWTFITNKGAAFGMFSNSRWIFIIGTFAVLFIAMYFVAAKKLYHWSGYLAATLIISGGIGNMIDRLSLQYVIDFIDVSPLLSHIGLSFYIFNLADCYVCVGAVILGIYMIFIHDKYDPKLKLKNEENAE